MDAEARKTLVLDNTFALELVGMHQPWQATPVAAPDLLVLNDQLALELGLDPEWLRSPAGIAALTGNQLPQGAMPVAQAYSGHQFGGFSPRLGDGRALLLGEVVDVFGSRRDLHLKGSGRTPFARGGDGKAAVGPMLREYIMGEAMHALGIPTTRALAVVATGEQVIRETVLPGAVLVRVAASHLRVGSFQYAAMQPATPDGVSLVQRLADFAIARHFPTLADQPAAERYLGLLEAVAQVQAELVARWMHVGFIHGVMNTDNTTISGETIDYGPCAFMDAFDPATVFSSIDHAGRYAYGNQPTITQWNLARLAEPLLPLIHPDNDRAVELATATVQGFVDRFNTVWAHGMRVKLGLARQRPDDNELVDALYTLLQAQHVDHTVFFRALAVAATGNTEPVRQLFAAPGEFDEWSAKWSSRLQADAREPDAVAVGMNAVNPVYIARNHLVEEALAAASAVGDLAPMRQLVDVLAGPYHERPGLERYALPAPESFGGYQTFCGT